MVRAVRTAHVNLSVCTYATMLVEPDHEQPALQQAPWSAIMAAGLPALSQRRAERAWQPRTILTPGTRGSVRVTALTPD